MFATGQRVFADFVRYEASVSFAQVVERIYAGFDLELTEKARAAMQAFIDDNPQGKHGIHRYLPSEYGLDVTATRKLFRRYTEHYGIREEPIGQPVKGKVRDL